MFLFLRSSEGPPLWGPRPLTSLRSLRHSLDVGLPSPPPLGGGPEGGGGPGRVLVWVSGQPACRAFLLMAVVLMLLLLTGIIVFLVTSRQ